MSAAHILMTSVLLGAHSVFLLGIPAVLVALQGSRVWMLVHTTTPPPARARLYWLRFRNVHHDSVPPRCIYSAQCVQYNHIIMWTHIFRFIASSAAHMCSSVKLSAASSAAHSACVYSTRHYEISATEMDTPYLKFAWSIIVKYYCYT